MSETLSGWSTTVRRGPHGWTDAGVVLLITTLCTLYALGYLVMFLQVGPEEGTEIALMMLGLSLLFVPGVVWGARRLVRGRTLLRVTVTDTLVRLRVLAPWGERDLPSVALAEVDSVTIEGQFFQQVVCFDQRKIPVSVPFSERQELLRRIQEAHAAARALPVEAPPDALRALIPSATETTGDTPIVLPASHDTLSARLRLMFLLLLAVTAGVAGVVAMSSSIHLTNFFDFRLLLFVLAGPILAWQFAQHLRASGERVVLQPLGGALLIRKMHGECLLSEQLIPFDQLNDIRLRPSAIRQKLFLNHEEHTVVVPPEARQPLVDRLKAWREQRRDLSVPEPAEQEPSEAAVPRRRPLPRKVKS